MELVPADAAALQFLFPSVDEVSFKLDVFSDLRSSGLRRGNYGILRIASTTIYDFFIVLVFS
jgi:hypothetical protein